jgi:hypothetical protein
MMFGFEVWRYGVLCVACAVLSASAPAAAQGEARSASSPIARDLFERGKERWASGNYEEAAALLAASHHQAARAGTLLLLADTYERLGRLHSAREAFQRAAALARASGDDTLEYRASTREAALVPRLPQLEIRVPRPMPRGLVVTLNGAEVPAEQLNTPLEKDAGHYQVDARALGYRAFSVQLSLSNDGPSPRSAQVIAVLLAPDGEETAPEPDEPAAARRELGWWVGGAGGAVLLASVVTLVVAVNENQSSEEACGLAGGAAWDDPNACSQSGVDSRNQARLLANLATVGGVLGLAGVGAGVALHLSAGSADEPASASVSWSAAF